MIFARINLAISFIFSLLCVVIGIMNMESPNTSIYYLVLSGLWTAYGLSFVKG